jgi:SAM-dependent methyltransferase
MAAAELVSQFEQKRPLAAPDVITHLMDAFRQIRTRISDPVTALRVLNGLLLTARMAAVAKPATRKQPRRPSTVGDIASCLPPALAKAAGLPDIASPVRKIPLDFILNYFEEPQPLLGLRLDASLLFRHAASQLYQEAHIELERDPQLSFWGLLPTPHGRLPRETRYTPANLVRALIEQAGAILTTPSHKPSRSLSVLDPACGSGIFLTEFARFAANEFPGIPVELCGIDLSPTAQHIATSALEIAAIEHGHGLTYHVIMGDALTADWPGADLILMNPPFASIEDIALQDRQQILNILGPLRAGRYDKAAAFLLKAWQSLKPGGVIATVLPASLLQTISAREIRNTIGNEARIHVIGRFEGFSYFSASLVETSFVVLEKPRAAAWVPSPSDTARILVAREGSEDAALRALRSGHVGPQQVGAVEILDLPYSAITSDDSWYPRRGAIRVLLSNVRSLGYPSAEDVFAIHQGVRTGSNAAFLLNEVDIRSLPKRDRAYFRPAAGQGAICDAQLLANEFLFFPYDARGLVLTTEEDLQRACPIYYERWLAPRRTALSQRKKIEHWWLPTWPRTWQFARAPKLVSTYSGGAGSFAYDLTGHYAVVQGFGWLPRSARVQVDAEEADFFETDLPWAYLALLNSGLFERIVGALSSRLAGGQLLFDVKYVSRVPLPDLAESKFVSIRRELASIGNRIHELGLRQYRHKLDRLVSEIYQIPIDDIGSTPE